MPISDRSNRCGDHHNGRHSPHYRCCRRDHFRSRARAGACRRTRGQHYGSRWAGAAGAERDVRRERSPDPQPRSMARWSKSAPGRPVWRRRAVNFVDTNVLVHATAAGSPFHTRAREALAPLAANGPLAISQQVLREYLAVTTRPQVWAKPLALAEALADTDSFSRCFTILE